MNFYSIKSTQHLPISLEEAWDFFSSPNNLQKITPPDMGFIITSDKKDGEKMYAGQIIAYKVSPFKGINTTWVTEITHVKPKEYFVDEQRFGPYSLWHHKHFIKPIKNGVEMTDIIDYKIPMGFLGDIMNALVVKNKLNQIFEYRFKKMEEYFGKYEE
jgi:ligand-binding SRPBCC domain-containing protein